MTANRDEWCRYQCLIKKRPVQVTGSGQSVAEKREKRLHDEPIGNQQVK